jgi:hypothetical protein
MAFVSSQYSIIIEEKICEGDAVYIIDLDKIGIVDDLIYLEGGIVMVAIELEDTFILTPIDDENLINLDYDHTRS